MVSPWYAMLYEQEAPVCWATTLKCNGPVPAVGMTHVGRGQILFNLFTGLLYVIEKSISSLYIICI